MKRQSKEQSGEERPPDTACGDSAQRCGGRGENERQKQCGRVGPSRKDEWRHCEGAEGHRHQSHLRPAHLAAEPVHGREREAASDGRERQDPVVAAPEDSEEEFTKLDVQVRDESSSSRFGSERPAAEPRNSSRLPKGGFRLRQGVVPHAGRDLTRSDEAQRHAGRQNAGEQERMTEVGRPVPGFDRFRKRSCRDSEIAEGDERETGEREVLRPEQRDQEPGLGGPPEEDCESVPVSEEQERLDGGEEAESERRAG